MPDLSFTADLVIAVVILFLGLTCIEMISNKNLSKTKLFNNKVAKAILKFLANFKK